ncbi:hypothetical protein, partial [Faecalibaculum rodentium]|uniref:hypothetical protein n=1 Tax=Faecalibaculum rodentium TaxID=1702221 RepID=UPI002582900A
VLSRYGGICHRWVINVAYVWTVIDSFDKPNVEGFDKISSIPSTIRSSNSMNAAIELRMFRRIGSHRHGPGYRAESWHLVCARLRQHDSVVRTHFAP